MPSTTDELFDEEPPSVNPYEVLGIEKTATESVIKSAYRKAALKNHPDKVTEENKNAAHTKFQSIALAYAVLSDPIRRKRFDQTGSTSESIADSDGFNWSDFYREQFAEAISDGAIEKFSKEYKGSKEEKDDLLAAFEECEGDMNQIYEVIMLSNPLEDEERFRKIFKDAIASGDVEGYKAFIKESAKSKRDRIKNAKSEAKEAEEYAKELGVADKLSGKGKSKAAGEESLMALIRGRQQSRGTTFLDNLEAKYGGGNKASKIKGKKRSKRYEEDEVEEDEEAEDISEEAFQAAAARLKKPAQSTEGGSRKRTKR